MEETSMPEERSHVFRLNNHKFYMEETSVAK